MPRTSTSGSSIPTKGGNALCKPRHGPSASGEPDLAITLHPAFYLLFFASILISASPSLYASGGWAATYGGGDSEHASSIQQTRDGGYIVAGETRSFGAGEPDAWVLKPPNVWVLKLTPDGAVDWQKTYGGTDQDEAHSIQQTRDGGYIVAGSTWSFGAGGEDIWVLKLRPDGTVEWQKTYGGGNWDGAYSVHETSDGGYIVAGDTSSFGNGGPAVWVLKLGPDG